MFYVKLDVQFDKHTLAALRIPVVLKRYAITAFRGSRVATSAARRAAGSAEDPAAADDPAGGLVYVVDPSYWSLAT